MSLRDDLCAKRAATEELGRQLELIETRLISRNAAHLVCRARSMLQATGELITQALRMDLASASVSDEAVTRAGAARP